MKEILEVVAGALFLIFGWWAAQKQRSDRSKKKTNWKGWLYSKSDEMAYALVSAIVVGYYRESFVYLLIWIGKKFPDTPIIKVFANSDEVWSFYYDAEGLILFFAGFFSVSIIKGIIALKSKFTKR